MTLSLFFAGHLVTGLCVSLAGLMAVGLSVILMTSCCALMGLFWTNIHLIIPPILLGIGIDDMFVIIQTVKVSKASEMLHPESTSTTALVRVGGVATPMQPAFSVDETPAAAAAAAAVGRRPLRRRQTAVVALLSRTLGKVGA